MQLFEILIPISLAVNILWPLISGKENPRLINLLPVLAGVLIVVHLNVEGYRWQMIPLYVLTGILLVITVPELVKPASGEFDRWSSASAGMIGIFILLLLATALPAALPIPVLPQPSGQFQVGTRTVVLIDESRAELYSEEDGPRKFMIQIWYPAVAGPQDRHAPWVSNATVYGHAISKYLGMAPFFLDHLKSVTTPAWQDAPVAAAEGGFPVILFSHGWNGFAAQNTEQALELASRGYVVVAVQHTYGAVVTVFPDGEIEYNNPEALPEGEPEPGYTEAARKLGEQWAQDIGYALDFMESQNQDATSPFFSSMDFSKVGVYGHSTGGGAAIQFCGMDERCTALLGMDPFMPPVSKDIIENGLSQTAFFMFSQDWFDETDSKNNRLFKQFYENFDDSTHVIAIRGTRHYDYSDLPMLSPVAQYLGLKGPINAKVVTEIINTYLTFFFNQELKGYPTDLFTGGTTYSDVMNLDYLRSSIYPIGLNLPGGLEFHLGEGRVDNGEWVPLRAEWLVGTEISRWVAVPWNPQVETLLDTLGSGDQLQLKMSNSDTTMFRVSSIQKMTMKELLASDPTKPSLLVVLFNDNQKDGTSWVITALPERNN